MYIYEALQYEITIVFHCFGKPCMHALFTAHPNTLYLTPVITTYMHKWSYIFWSVVLKTAHSLYRSSPNICCINIKVIFTR
jgi:hypothetical protein